MGHAKGSLGCFHSGAGQSGAGRKRAFLDCSSVPQGVRRAGALWRYSVLGAASSKALTELFDLARELKGILIF